ncbi:MAG: PrsW family glutamic-type intramembrane protease, partial [Candidatus Cybelea sp.]
RRLATATVSILVLGAVAWLSGSVVVDTLFVLAVAPSLYIAWHFHHADKYKTESLTLLLGTFGLGAAFAFVAALIEAVFPLPKPGSFTFLYFLFSVALVEELAKLAAVRVFAYRSAHFDETMDGVIFGITAAMGFATVENIMYVFNDGAAVALYRAFVTVPGHAFYGAIMGYYLGQAKMYHKPSLAVWGLLIAVFLHGLFDELGASLGTISLVTLPALVWIIYFTIVKKEIAKAQSESLFAPKAGG